MDVLAWEVVVEALQDYNDFENPSFERALVYARKQVRDLSEVRPILTPASVRHDPWQDSACSPEDYADTWVSSGNCW